MENEDLVSVGELPCCPQVTRTPCCDRLLFTYRLEYNLTDVPVEVAFTFEFERCPGDLALGDLVYSTTLLPGEKVRLYTSSRRNRFTFDSEREVSYRHEQSSEETFYMSSMDRFMSDLTVTDQGGGSSQNSGSFNTEGSVSGAIESFFAGPSASASGSYDAQSSFDFMRELNRHAEASHERSVNATRAASSVSVGEVQQRAHAEGESESTFEASTRTIENRNQCHAVTYFAYQLVKRQTVKFRLVAVARRVKDDAADTRVDVRTPQLSGNVAVIPQGVLATDVNRIDVETIGRTAKIADRVGVIGSVGQIGGAGAAGLQTSRSVNLINSTGFTTAAGTFNPRGRRRISTDERAAALKVVDDDLVSAGILDQPGGAVSPKIQAELGFERTTCLPTPAIVVKGCLDECNVCEKPRQREIELDLRRKSLENQLLEKQIELLEKSQEYRCCPAGEVEDEDA